MPKVSIILPVRDGEKYLRPALESVLSQTFRDFEMLCIDDGSKDGSQEILRAYAAMDDRIQLFTRPHRGLISSLNEALSLAQAPLVARMDCDDIAEPERLRWQYDRIASDEKLWVLGTNEVWIDELDREIARPTPVVEPQNVRKALATRCVISHPTVMMRRQPILQLGGYRAAYAVAEDYDLWLRVSEVADIDNLPGVGLKYRVHANAVSELHKVRQRVSSALARATHRLRLGGLPDPTGELSDPPDLWLNPVLDELIADEIKFFRLVDLAFNHAQDANKLEFAFVLMQQQDKGVTCMNEKLWQETLLRLAGSRRSFDAIKLATFYRALLIHPGRFLRNIMG
jgi:glycosyltransferase involved in cell wall biosynthesis